VKAEAYEVHLLKVVLLNKHELFCALVVLRGIGEALGAFETVTSRG
jgi:hypothetical protein